MAGSWQRAALAAPAPRVLDVGPKALADHGPPRLRAEVAETVAINLAVTVLWQGDYDTAVDPRFDVVKRPTCARRRGVGNLTDFDGCRWLILGGRGCAVVYRPGRGPKFAMRYHSGI